MKVIKKTKHGTLAKIKGKLYWIPAAGLAASVPLIGAGHPIGVPLAFGSTMGPMGYLLLKEELKGLRKSLKKKKLKKVM